MLRRFSHKELYKRKVDNMKYSDSTTFPVESEYFLYLFTYLILDKVPLYKYTLNIKQFEI